MFFLILTFFLPNILNYIFIVIFLIFDGKEILTYLLREFVERENIIYKFQSGFRKGFSTDTCLS